jgi:hypothetical protein
MLHPKISEDSPELNPLSESFHWPSASMYSIGAADIIKLPMADYMLSVTLAQQ